MYQANTSNTFSSLTIELTNKLNTGHLSLPHVSSYNEFWLCVWWIWHVHTPDNRRFPNSGDLGAREIILSQEGLFPFPTTSEITSTNTKAEYNVWTWVRVIWPETTPSSWCWSTNMMKHLTILWSYERKKPQKTNIATEFMKNAFPYR